MSGPPAPITPEPLEAAVSRLADAPVALLALGIPRCPACMMLPVSLAAVAAARPAMPVALSLLADPADWALREGLLWPRGITVSRSSVPVLTVLEEGRAVAQRRGGAPAAVIDAWLTEVAGPGAGLPPGTEEAEQAAMRALAERRAQQMVVKGGRPGLGTPAGQQTPGVL